jgi:hypothetical protein
MPARRCATYAGAREEVAGVGRLTPGRATGTVLDADPVALAEIELCGELMIAASSAPEDRLSAARIDEVLRVGADESADPAGTAGPGDPLRP